MEEIATPDQLLDNLAEQLKTLLAERAIEQPIMVGIHTGGVWVAKALHQKLALEEPLSTLDISFYRDDFSRIGMNPEVKPSELPPHVDDRHIILVDDVLHTGRTIRAAMNEIFDYGRPAKVVLAVMLDRGGRELPFEANIVGKKLELKRNEQVKLTGPEPLDYVVQKINPAS